MKRYALFVWEAEAIEGWYRRFDDLSFESHGACVEAYKRKTLRTLASTGQQFKIRRVSQ